MKSNQCLSIAVLLGPLLFLVGAAYAGVPLQTKPANIDAFLGKWEGTWNNQGASGGVIAELSRLAADTVRFQATIAETRNANAYEAPAKFLEGELNVDLPTLTMVFRLHGDDNLEVSYVHNGSPGTYSLTRKTKVAAMPAKPAATSAATREAFLNTLVAGSPWNGEFGPRPPGTLTVRFAYSGGSLTGELTSINAGTSSPGPLADVQLNGDKLSFKTPGGSVNRCVKRIRRLSLSARFLCAQRFRP